MCDTGRLRHGVLLDTPCCDPLPRHVTAVRHYTTANPISCVANSRRRPLPDLGLLISIEAMRLCVRDPNFSWSIVPECAMRTGDY